jgi:hypothetical protein
MPRGMRTKIIRKTVNLPRMVAVFDIPDDFARIAAHHKNRDLLLELAALPERHKNKHREKEMLDSIAKYEELRSSVYYRGPNRKEEEKEMLRQLVFKLFEIRNG